MLGELAAAGRTLFTIEDARLIAQAEAADIARLLHRLVAKRWLQRLERGKYRLIPLEAGSQAQWGEHELLVAATLVQPYYLAYATALHYYGYSERQPRPIWIATTQRKRPVTVNVDLDFSVLPGLSSADLEPGLTAWFAQTAARHGIEIVLRDLHRANGAARIRARFVGPLRHPSPLLLDITLDEPVLPPPQRWLIVTALFAGLPPRVLVYALEEILAEKLRSILQRGKARDYYDV
ncbi:MAG: nucleotidyl transferase AbiEii/AbiGii toxin family protein [Anaerolineae bacterium]